MRYIALVAFAAAVLWMVQDYGQPGASIAATTTAPTAEVIDYGRIVIVGHRERL